MTRRMNESRSSPLLSVFDASRSCLRLLVTGCLLLAGVEAGDWRQFRGTATDSVAIGEILPTALSSESIAWQAELAGRGLSGPIVVGSQVLITASSGYADDRLHVISVDADTGAKRWERQFQATGRTGSHTKMCMATPTPASDGERMYAFYSTNDLICLDLDGNLQWYRGLGQEFPNASNSLGMSSSPIVIGSTVIVQVESDAESFAIGVDVLSGETKWQLERPRRANWSSPSLLPSTVDRPALVLLQSSVGLSAVDPVTGTELWTFEDGAATIPSTTVSDEKIIVPSNGLTVLEPSLNGTEFRSLWNAKQLSPSTSSPLVTNGMTFSVNGAGVLTAGSLESGERLWQMRLHGAFSSTPIASNGHLYFFSESGMATIVRPGEKNGEIVSQLDLTESILCSPAAANDSLYVRSDGHLWKFTARP